MDVPDIFVSVGATATATQESFVCAVEDRLRAEGFLPHTVGRNTFTSDAPLKTVLELMRRCSGVVVIALERSFFPSGFDKPGGSCQTPLKDIRLPTPWNQIEAAMAYISGLPLLVIVEKGVKIEGLLAPDYDWYVQQVELTTASLSTMQFNAVLSSWKEKFNARAREAPSPLKGPADTTDLGQIPIGRLLGIVKPAQLWTILTALAALVAGAFTLGAHLFPHK